MLKKKKYNINIGDEIEITKNYHGKTNRIGQKGKVILLGVCGHCLLEVEQKQFYWKLAWLKKLGGENANTGRTKETF